MEQSDTNGGSSPSGEPGSQRERFLIPGSIVLSGVIIALAVLYSGGALLGGGTSPKLVKDNQAAAGGAAVENIEDNDPAIGSPTAKVVLVEFSDFQCPFCRKFWRESLPKIEEKYVKTGAVRFVYRDFPLSNIHPGAEAAAEAAECAGDQGKFWEMHDKIFAEQDKKGEGTIQFAAADLKRWAREIALNGAGFDSCLDSGKYKDEVAKDYKDGVALGVSGTPHVFVNGKLLIRGALPYEQIESIIEEELAGK